MVFTPPEIWNVTLWNIEVLNFPVTGDFLQVQKQTEHKNNCNSALHLTNYQIMASTAKEKIVYTLCFFLTDDTDETKKKNSLGPRVTAVAKIQDLTGSR